VGAELFMKIHLVGTYLFMKIHLVGAELFMKIHLVGAELFMKIHLLRAELFPADGRTDMRGLKVAFSQFCERQTHRSGTWM
jgi:hypothetical protein